MSAKLVLSARPAKLALAGRRALHKPLFWVALLTLLALGVRLYRLGGPVLRWDEGWSLAQASLPWSALWRVATEEWQPPLYAALLKLWLASENLAGFSSFGKSATAIRLFSVVVGILTVPLTYAVARAWADSGETSQGGKTAKASSASRERMAILAAGFAALWPLLVYYGQVARMYALTALLVLGAAWFALRGEKRPSWGNDAGLAVCSLFALYTLYHTVWALLGIWLYALIVRLQRPRGFPTSQQQGSKVGVPGPLHLLVVVLAAALLYLPWLLVARTTIETRLSASGVAKATLAGLVPYLQPALQGMAFTYASSRWAMPLLGAVLLLGVAAGPWSWAEARRLLLPILTVAPTILGVAYVAQTYWFAPRHLVPACAFFGLLLAWALDRLTRRFWPLLPVALVALALCYWPTCSRFVYDKMLEVTGPFDPAADYRYISTHGGSPQDIAFFNALARAGWYDTYRTAQDPAWSYAMRWDPIIEPMDEIAARIESAAQTHPRLWFVLYKGTYGPNAALGAWIDRNLYPAGGEWQEDMLYLAEVAPPKDGWVESARADVFDGNIHLVSARWAVTGDACALELRWRADGKPAGSYKVFVHATDDSDRLLAQHDSVPANGARPTDGWKPGEEIVDRHGLFLPTQSAPQKLHLRVGLYDPNTGERLRLPDGSDEVDLGEIETGE